METILKIRYICIYRYIYIWLPRWRQMVKNLPANAGGAGDVGSISG